MSKLRRWFASMLLGNRGRCPLCGQRDLTVELNTFVRLRYWHNVNTGELLDAEIQPYAKLWLDRDDWQALYVVGTKGTRSGGRNWLGEDMRM